MKQEEVTDYKLIIIISIWILIVINIVTCVGVAVQ